MKKERFFSDLERLQIVAQRIFDAKVDITAEYGKWIEVTMACASLGEQAREPYHLICSQYPNYKRAECDQKFDNCLKTGLGMVTLGTLMQMAKDAGVDVSMPKGRRAQSQDEKEEEKRNRMVKIAEQLREQAEWRYNTWRQRPEVKEPEQEWRPIQDRDLDTFYCRLLESGLNVKQQDVRAMIFNRDFCPDYDALNEWLDSLMPWNPDTDPDYLRQFYLNHLEFEDPENEELYDRMFKKWHVGLVGLIRGVINENPLMPIFKGPQHIGKTFFVRHILPPHLSDYRLEPSPTERIDKDFTISLSETPLILLDEISFGNAQKAEAFKYIITSVKSNVRDSYARFRELRKRRASLIATTNEDNFIPNTEGTRRYLVVDLKDTVDLDNFPLPHEGAYAQALYLLNHGFETKPDQEESQMISQHNKRYVEPNDCEEALKTLFRVPTENDKPLAFGAGDILNELNYNGYRGNGFNVIEIGKAMKRMEFPKKPKSGRTKYLVVRIDPETRKREAETDALDFM